jgi:hypothetical protein
MEIESGWRFSTADFSINAAGDGSESGVVMLVRDASGVALWHKITDEMNADDYPDLYVKGRGLTLEEAVTNANLRAARLPALAE